jgi:hypothetical protein
MTAVSVLAAELAEALRLMRALQAMEAMQPHTATLNGARVGLEWLRQTLPISAAAYRDLREIAEDLREVWGEVRASRAEANTLCEIDVALQHAAGAVADGLRDQSLGVARMLAKVGV